MGGKQDWFVSPRGKRVLVTEVRPGGAFPPLKEGVNVMITLGVILLIIGLIAKVGILWTIGVILLVVGVILALLGMMGRAVGGRPHYY